MHALGFAGVENVRIGKFIEISVDASSKQEAEQVTRDVCQKLLANPVMEDFSFVVEEVP